MSMMNQLTKHIVGEEHLKQKGGIFNCLDDILMANETAIVLPGRDSDIHHQMHPIVIVEPKIEIKVEANLPPGSPRDRLMENLLQVPEARKKKSKSNGSSSPYSTESTSHRHHQPSGHHRGSTTASDTNKENVSGNVGGGDMQENHHKHHCHHGHGSTTKHHRHHHHHHHHHNGNHHHATTGTANGETGGQESSRPAQVLRKYIIKKITIRKQDGSTKKIVIKKPVDEPNGPVKLSKVAYSCLGVG